ncbi:MAG TPA: hypothetical protein VN915_06785 [Elusimicrobiota bacterium]|nr:hypothetical protein [Elusimicrobiota bacterium]
MGADGNGIGELGQQMGSAGRNVGPKINQAVFVAPGAGFVWQDSNGAWWQERLAQNADGTTYFDETGRPTFELVPVSI